MQTKSIGAVAHEANLSASAIRYYERLGLLRPPARAHGQRRYDDSVSRELRLIRLAQEAGFTLREIRRLLHGFPDGTPPAARWQALSRAKIEGLKARIARLNEMKAMLQDTLRCQCATLEECAAEGCGGEEAGSASLCCAPRRRPDSPPRRSAARLQSTSPPSCLPPRG